MENFRKANNISANGQRKHHERANSSGGISEVIEDDMEHEQHDESDNND